MPASCGRFDSYEERKTQTVADMIRGATPCVRRIRPALISDARADVVGIAGDDDLDHIGAPGAGSCCILCSIFTPQCSSTLKANCRACVVGIEIHAVGWPNSMLTTLSS